MPTIQITDITDDKLINANNLSPDLNPIVILRDYENFKVKLKNHCKSLKLLTKKILRLFSGVKIKTTQFHYSKCKKIKNLRKINFYKSKREELLILKKLLVINLRSFQVMQRLHQENCDLQKLIDMTYQYNMNQRLEFEKIKDENEKLNIENVFLLQNSKFFFEKLNILNESTLEKNVDTVFQDYSYEEDNSNVSSNTVAIITNLNKPNKKFESLYNFDHGISSDQFEMIANLLNLDSLLNKNIYIDLQIDTLSNLRNSFLNVFEEKKAIEPIKNKKEKISKGNDTTNYPQVEATNLNLRSIEISNVDAKGTNIYDKVLEKLNLPAWKEFSFGQNLQKSLTQLKIPDFKEAQIEPDRASISEFTQLQLKTSSLKCNENTENEDVKECLEKRVYDYAYRDSSKEYINDKSSERKNRFVLKIRKLYSFERTHLKVLKKLRMIKSTRFYDYIDSDEESNASKEYISTGVGGNMTLLADKESQVDFDRLSQQMQPKNTNNFPNIKVQVVKKTAKNVGSLSDRSKPEITSNLNQEFKKSLKSLQQIIKLPKNLPKQKSVVSFMAYKAQQKKRSDKKPSNTQQRSTASKEVARERKNTFDGYTKENYVRNKMPEMYKAHRVILQNKSPQGVDLKFVTSKKFDPRQLSDNKFSKTFSSNAYWKPI